MENSPKNQKMKVSIIGAGWAGLSCAVHLAEKKHFITLLEAAPQAGGRARAVSFGNDTVDNGQHLLIGAYSHFLNLLKKLNIPEEKVLSRIPFNLHMKSPQKTFKLNFPNLHSPLQLLMGFLNIQGFSPTERWAIAQFLKTIRKINFQLPQDTSVEKFLTAINQPNSLIKILWGPLALASLSTPIEKASAKVFLRVLEEVFNHSHHHSDWLFAKCDLSELLSNPALQYLKTQKHEILYNQRATELIIQDNRCVGIKTNDQYFESDLVILATPPKTTAKLLHPHPHFSTLSKNLCQFTYQPIMTLYFKFSKPIQFKIPMIGLIDSKAHWIFDRSLSKNPTILSVIISGTGEHQDMTQKALVNTVIKDIQRYYPELGDPIAYKVITEKQAAFSCEVGIETIRPNNATPISNLFLVGDYTQTGYPATLEGAVLSGMIGADLCTQSLVNMSTVDTHIGDYAQ